VLVPGWPFGLSQLNMMFGQADESQKKKMQAVPASL